MNTYTKYDNAKDKCHIRIISYKLKTYEHRIDQFMELLIINTRYYY